jgi:ATP-dependent Clp protease ATP-binding subunit ClpC
MEVSNMQGTFPDFMDHMTDNARGSLQHAETIARGLGSAYVGTEHLMLGVLSQNESVGARLLFDGGITLDRARLALNLTPRALTVSTGARGLSETAKLTLRMSWDIAQDYDQDYCGTEHILYSILTQKNARATILLRDMNINVNELIAEIEDYLSKQHLEAASSAGNSSSSSKSQSKQPYLAKFGSDLTARARNDELDPVIGRDQQIARMITILSRRAKNNPVLIGEPGVGKTAIVEGLAQRIIAEDVPENLLDKRVIQLDMGAMVAGTKYRGEFEDRLKKVVAELTRDDSTIVFVDEMHLVIGAGSAEGTMDAANMLKPLLAKGKLRMIGATTINEFRKYVERDSALERRFQSIIVPEPSSKDTVAILRGLRGHYEDFHGVNFTDEVIDDVVYMAERYVADRFMPDKALDVMDEAASLVKIRNNQKPSHTKILMRELRNLEDKMEDASQNQEYEKAAFYKTRISRVRQELEDQERVKSSRPDKFRVASGDIAEAVSVMTNIPSQQLKRNEILLLKKLEQHLAKSIVGQSEAIRAVSRAIRRNRSGISDGDKPIGSFVFMGPTGVGKTELARVVAREVFGSDKSLLKIDMSEFSEKHTASRLVGAPAGYIGYDDGGQLTERVRRQPYSVVLFDEIEKAHRDIFHLLLQILEDGCLTDSKGRRVSFKNTIIILTSNLGSDRMYKESGLGFRSGNKDDDESSKLDSDHKDHSATAHKSLEGMMRPELINRFDDVVVFRSLSRREVNEIFNLQIKRLQARLQRQGLGLTVSPSAKKYLVEKGYSANHGVRPLRRVIQECVEHAVADKILSGECSKGDILNVTMARGELAVKVVTEQGGSRNHSTKLMPKSLITKLPKSQHF